MPLPKYQQQVEPALTPITEVKPDPSAGQALDFAGKALKGTADTVESISSDIYKRGITADVAKGIADSHRAVMPLINDALSKEGESAAPAVANAKQAVQDVFKKTGAGLDDHNARDLFDEEAQKQVDNLTNVLDRHGIEQVGVANDSKVHAYTVETINSGGTLWSDPQALEAQAQHAADFIRTRQKSTADGDAQIMVMRRDMWAQAVDGALKSGNTVQAGLIFGAHQGELGVHGPELQAALHNAVSTQDALTKADAITTAAMAPDPTTGRVPIEPNGTVILNGLLAIKDPMLREKTRTFLEQTTTLQTAAAKGQINNLHQTLEERFNNTHNMALVKAMPEWSKLNSLDSSKTHGLELEMLGYFKATKELQEPSDAQKASYTGFALAAQAGDPRVVNMTPAEFQTWAATTLAKPDRERARAEYLDAVKRANEPGKVTEPDKELARQSIEGALGKASDWGNDLTKPATAYEVNKSFDNFIAANPKASTAEKQQQLNKLLLNVAIPTGKGFFGGVKTETMSVAQARAQGLSTAGAEPQWSDAEKTAAKAVLSQKGKEATPELIDAVLREAYTLPPAPVVPAPPPPEVPAGGRVVE